MGTEGKVKILEQVDGRGISPTPKKEGAFSTLTDALANQSQIQAASG